MIVEFQDSTEKQRVRQELWRPVFEKLFEKIKNIKYLTLPGPNCIDLRTFLDLNLIKIENTVSVEREKDFADKIGEFYAKEVGLQTEKVKDSIYHDNIENLINNGAFVKRWFPFHIINLDLFGSPFSIDSQDESKIFNLFDDVIKKQKEFGREVYIFVTVKLDTPDKLGSKNISTIKLINTKILLPLIKKSPNAFLKDKMNKPCENKNEWLKIYAMILSIIYQSDRNTNITLHSYPYTYIGKSSGKTTRMIACVFKINYSNERPIDVKYHETKKNGQISTAMELIQGTVWIN